MVDLALWMAAAVLSYQAGFYCAWSFTDYLLGHQRQLLLHVVLEVMCIIMCFLSTWVIDFDRSPYTTSVERDEEESDYVAPALMIV